MSATCITCYKTKSLDEFPKRKDKSGHLLTCNECVACVCDLCKQRKPKEECALKTLGWQRWQCHECTGRVPEPAEILLFKCEPCGFTCHTLQLLRIHKKSRMHAIKIGAEDLKYVGELKPFVCYTCKYSSKDLIGLRQHEKTKIHAARVATNRENYFSVGMPQCIPARDARSCDC